MSLLLLDDELLLQIFDYFHFTELIGSFYEIMCHNRRFHRLITSQLRPIHMSTVDLRMMTKAQFSFTIGFLRSQENFSRSIRSLTLSNRYTFGEIHSFFNQINLDELSNLKELTLIEPCRDDYRILFPNSMSRLTKLTIEDPESDDDDRVILIDEMTDLIELNVQSMATVQFRSRYDRLEKLKVKKLNRIDLIGFSTFFPNLKELDLSLTGELIDLDRITIPLLSVLKLRSIDVPDEICKKFFSNFPQLRELFYSNEIHFTDSNRFDPFEFEKVLHALPLLETFQIELFLVDYSKGTICDLTAAFQSEFYLSKNWNIVCESRADCRDFHVYSLPMIEVKHLEIATDGFVSASILFVHNPYDEIEHLKLRMTSTWPTVTRLFSNVKTLEIFQSDSSQLISPVSILSYLNKTMFLSRIQTLILPSPCHLDDSFFQHLFRQSSVNIKCLDISCDHFLRLMNNDVLSTMFSIEILHLRNDSFPSSEVNRLIDLFKTRLRCLSLFLSNDVSLMPTIEAFLDRFQLLFSLQISVHENLTMFTHLQLREIIRVRPEVGAELRSNKIRIWQK